VHQDITVDSLAFLRVITPRPELVLLGAGADISFRLGPDIMKMFEELRIGIEVMDSVSQHARTHLAQRHTGSRPHTQTSIAMESAGQASSLRIHDVCVSLCARVRFFCCCQGNAIATYNILTDEGRTVLAAMLQKPEPKVVEHKPTRSELMRRKLGYWQFGKE